MDDWTWLQQGPPDSAPFLHSPPLARFLGLVSRGVTTNAQVPFEVEVQQVPFEAAADFVLEMMLGFERGPGPPFGAGAFFVLEGRGEGGASLVINDPRDETRLLELLACWLR